LTPQQESALSKKQSQKRSALRVPRRPAWTTTTTPSELERAERDAFLEWRRGLAQLQESDDLLLTPFERNLEVWRQLWRVIERSDLVVQIVDARNPLLFRTEDLEKYVLEVDPEKRNLLLVNKADLMTLEQRRIWADWFEGEGIRFAFYSARLAKEAMENQSEITTGGSDEELDISEERADELADEIDEFSIDDRSDYSDDSTSHQSENDVPESPVIDPRTQILTVNELQALFLRESPPPKGYNTLT
jgi:large subunit GTPase 1